MLNAVIIYSLNDSSELLSYNIQLISSGNNLLNRSNILMILSQNFEIQRVTIRSFRLFRESNILLDLDCNFEQLNTLLSDDNSIICQILTQEREREETRSRNRNFINQIRLQVSQSENKKEYMPLIYKILDFQDNKVIKFEEYDYSIGTESYLPITFIEGKEYVFNTIEQALEWGFIEDLNTMSWYKEKFNKPLKFLSDSHYYKFNNSTVKLESKTYLLSEGKRYTFGVEFECEKLLLPQYIYKDLNADCVRDGSLNNGEGGPEIVTGVLGGDEGLNHLQKICKELTNRGTVNKTCGMHIHLGGFDYSKENLIYLYKLCLLIEDEVFKLVPISRRNNTYCRKLNNLNFISNINQNLYDYKMNINTDLESLINYIAYDKSKIKKLTRKQNHPMGAKCGYRHETPRYCWANFVPAIFSTRGSEDYKTLEIRIHSGTTSYIKTKNWLLLWMGVLWFVENKKQEIKEGLTINHILYSAYPKRGGKLVDYFRRRIEMFSEENNESKEYSQEKEQIKSIKDQLCV